MDTNTCTVLGISMAGPLLGSLLGVSFRPKESLMYAMLSFAGGTMLAISFLEMIPESLAMCGTAACVAGILIGLLAMVALEEFFPGLKNEKAGAGSHGSLEKTSLMMVAAIFLHNFPEGMAMASGASMSHPGKAMLIAMAIAVHDIPEGICTSAPYFYATGRRWRAFFLSASTALPVLAGFILGRIVFTGMSDFLMGIIIGSIAGLMIYISCEELIPTSQTGRHPIFSMAALILGIIFVIFLGSQG